MVESLPDALEGSLTSRVLDGFAGVGDAACDGVLEEGQQGACAEAEASDLVGEPDAEGSAATGPRLPTLAAQDASCSECSLLWVAAVGVCVVESVEDTVTVECAAGVAVWTLSLFELLDDAEPLLVVLVEPSFAHGSCLPGTGTTSSVAGSKTWCEEAGSDEENENEEVRSRIENCRHNRKGGITEFPVQNSSRIRMGIR